MKKLLLIGGGMLVLGGILVVIASLDEKSKAGKLDGTPIVTTGNAASSGAKVAGPDGRVVITGKVICTHPLQSMLEQKPCLFYKYTLTAKYMGKFVTALGTEKMQSTSMTADQEKQTVDFTIDDGSGPVLVKFKDTSEMKLIESAEKHPQAIEQAAASHAVLPQNTPIELFTEEESYLPVPPTLTVVGKLNGNTIGPDEVILTAMSPAELISEKSSSAVGGIVGGLITAGIGLVLFCLGWRKKRAPISANLPHFSAQ